MKMHILVREEIPTGFALEAVARAFKPREEWSKDFKFYPPYK